MGMSIHSESLPTRVVASNSSFRFLMKLQPHQVEPYRRAIARHGFQLDELHQADVIQLLQLGAHERGVLAVA